MSPTFRSLSVSASVALALVLAPNASSQNLLAYDGLDYGATAGNPDIIAEKDGGAGWASPWIGVGHSGALVAYYPLDSSGWDAGEFQAHGTVNGGVFDSDTPTKLFWSTGSYKPNLGGNHINLNPHVDKYAKLTRYTISCWFKTSRTNPSTIFSASDGPANFNDCAIKLSGSKVRYDVRGEFQSTGQLVSQNTLTDNQWHHVAVVVEGDGNAKLYVDGMLDDEAHQGSFSYVLDVTQVSIGRNVSGGSGTQLFQGNIDELAIWGSALSATEVQDLANGATIPLLIPGPNESTGPNLDTASLGSNTLPHTAFSLAGYDGVGNRLSDSRQIRAGRQLSQELDLGVDAVYYMSMLVRRTDGGTGTSGLEVQLADNDSVHAQFGWNAAGVFTAGFSGSSQNGSSMAQNVTYFLIAKIESKASQTDDDLIFVRTYRSAQSIPADDTGLSGQGNQANNWSVIGDPARIRPQVDQIWITPLGSSSTYTIDEIRVGTTWESVTRLGYGQGCGGPVIGQTNRLAIGSTDYSVDVAGAPVSQPGVVFVGVAPAAIDLSTPPFNLTGCTLLNTADLAVPIATDTNGRASLSVPVPNSPQYYSVPLYWQFGVLDPTNVLEFSDGLQTLVER